VRRLEGKNTGQARYILVVVVSGWRLDGSWGETEKIRAERDSSRWVRGDWEIAGRESCSGGMGLIQEFIVLPDTARTELDDESAEMEEAEDDGKPDVSDEGGTTTTGGLAERLALGTTWQKKNSSTRHDRSENQTRWNWSAPCIGMRKTSCLDGWKTIQERRWMQAR